MKRSKIKKLKKFLQDLAETMNHSFFLVIFETDKTGRNITHTHISQWFGEAKEGSRAPHFALTKAGELLAKGCLKGASFTPIKDFKDSCGYAGGMRKDNIIIACSGFKEDQIDRLISLMAYWNLIRQDEVSIVHQRLVQQIPFPSEQVTIHLKCWDAGGCATWISRNSRYGVTYSPKNSTLVQKDGDINFIIHMAP